MEDSLKITYLSICYSGVRNSSYNTFQEIHLYVNFCAVVATLIIIYKCSHKFRSYDHLKLSFTQFNTQGQILTLYGL